MGVEQEGRNRSMASLGICRTAVIAVLIWCLALRACALDESIGEKEAFNFVVNLHNASDGDVAIASRRLKIVSDQFWFSGECVSDSCQRNVEAR